MVQSLNLIVCGLLAFMLSSPSSLDLEVSFQALSSTESPSLNILAFGDVMLSRHVRVLMDEQGKEYLFENLDLSELQKGMDIVHANLEGPIHGEGTKGGTSMIFSFNQDVAPFLKEKGFNLLSIANNHALDQGWAAHDETIEVLEENSIDWCGHPSEPEKESVHYGESPTGMTYAFACFQDITHKLDLEKAKVMLSQVDPKVDLLIVSVHWGYEYKALNNARQQEMAHGFIDSGADLVIGHHPHVVQNLEVYKGVPIFYSLGNFVFDQYWSKETQEGLAIRLKLTSDEYFIELFPMKSERAQSRLMNEEERGVWVENYFLKHGNYDETMQEMIRNFRMTIER